MPELSCGCILLRESIRLQKEIRDENDKFVEYVSMTHDYYHLVDKTGKNQKKVELFNKGEELRMNITKRMFNILVDDERYDVDDDWNFTVRKDDDDNEDEEVEDDDVEEENMTDPYDYMSPKSKAQYDRDVERRWKEEEEEKQEKRGQKCINKKPNKNTPQNKWT